MLQKSLPYWMEVEGKDELVSASVSCSMSQTFLYHPKHDDLRISKWVLNIKIIQSIFCK